MLIGESILRFARVDHPEQFVDFEAIRYLMQQAFQLHGSFRKFSSVVLSDRRLECAIEISILLLILFSSGRHALGVCHDRKKERDRPIFQAHTFRMLPLCLWQAEGRGQRSLREAAR